MICSRTTKTTLVVMLGLATGALCQDGGDPRDVKPERCEGVSTIEAVIPTIKDLNGQDFHQEVGKMNYSLAMTGNLVLNSSVTAWHCGPTKNEVESNGTMRTLTTVYGAGQQACYSDPIPVDNTWITGWNTIVFSGELYFSVIVHEKTCASPPTLIDINSPCSYNATTEGGLVGTGVCRWTITDKVHNAGDQPDGQDGEDGSGEGE
ncbi:uncharacterized protein MELLADRAFT_124075 [Melampsora larici-populina 98AG31]|uniref:Secreted protein n=1 Tax=Melampsora larici-populina (strain 98AG31 / pathotype 3-4-7) TaxID=747676 RepID=F4S3P2_MELLP|nr:uncharacterized protein MELLADRAFT_124075 [Melampsora larici-populina 98AG31]EGG00706.1 secreted protein [Melampsora larici-populina 98AG31]